MRETPYVLKTPFYAIANEVVGVLRAAEKLLAVNGHAVEMCPRYGTRRAS